MDDLETVTVLLPTDLVAFARACAGRVNVSEVVAAALKLLRAQLTELGAHRSAGQTSPADAQRAAGSESHALALIVGFPV